MTESKAEELIKLPPFEFCQKEKDIVFREALLEELCFHYANNTLFRKFCEKKNFEPTVFKGNLSDIPPVAVSVFKELGKELASVPQEEIKIILQSSATSGVPSSVPIDKDTAKRQAKVMIKVVQEFIGKERKPFLVMDINPQEGFRHLLGARFAAVSGYLNFASKVGYFLKANDRHQFYFDIESIREYIANLEKDVPVVVFGFTYILYAEVLRPCLSGKEYFILPKGSKIIHIGGWKKLENEKISKEDFNQAASRLFGIEPEDVIDIYGFTEQMGLNYPDCQCGYKHASIYSEVLVRDTITKEVLPAGEIGTLEFLTPIPHSYPGNVILTDDIGVIEDSPCPYHRSGTRFKILGRLKKAEIRGCGDVLSSKLKFSDDLSLSDLSPADTFRVEYWKGAVISASDTDKARLRFMIDRLKEKIDWLRSQPIDGLIGLIGRVAQRWGDAGDPLNAGLQEKGLPFLSAWCGQEHLIRMSTMGLRHNRMYMDTFLPLMDSTKQYMKATSRGLTCHWLAGNVQVLGMFALVQCILTKNVNLLKISSKDDGVFRRMLMAFEGISFTTKGGYTLYGDDLLQTIGIVYFSHQDNTLGKMMSEAAAVRVAWGGREAVQTVASYPSDFDCEDIILGPKISFSVVACESLEEERQVKKLARKVAVDASVFDQTGCASTHNVYVEKGGDVSPREFAVMLAEGMRKTGLQIPKGEVSTEQIAAIHSIRGVYDFKGEVFASDDSTWTVLYCEDDHFNPPVYSRVIFVHPVDHIEDSLKYIDDHIQTIGLAATGEKAIRYAEKATAAGAMRLPSPGKMLNFESPWDGIVIMERLVRWNTLGGPLL